MQQRKIVFLSALLCLILSMSLSGLSYAGEAKVKVNFSLLEDKKDIYDDTTPILTELPIKDIVTPEVYDSLTFDIDKMKSTWSQAVGFKSPDVVGKVAPEIKPGEYGHTDKDKYPFKELMTPDHYKRFAPGAEPHMGNYSKIKVVPTRQYFWALPIAEATLKNSGKTKQDEKGYIIDESYVAGYPFPQPSGTHKGQQVMYNWEKRYTQADNFKLYTRSLGINKGLNEDFRGLITVNYLKQQARLITPPLGWYDDRAKKNGELLANASFSHAPRDLYGNVLSLQSFVNPDKDNLFLMYINGMRRVRKLSGSDTQDPMGGQDLIYEDADGFNQKMSLTRYPYTYEVIEEREYLLPAYTMDGSTTVAKDNKEYVNFEFERRPVFVVKLIQQDPNFVYSYRKIFVDKETFIILFTEAYDQKEKLYRTIDQTFAFFPEMGMFIMNDFLARDHQDLHSTYIKSYGVPMPEMTRRDFSLTELSRKGK